MKNYYRETDKMFDVICDEYHLLQMMARFGIQMGVGENTVREVCDKNGVDAPTFLAIANYLKFGSQAAEVFIETVSPAALMQYLKQAHTYFLHFQLPNIRRRLLTAIDCSQSNEVAFLILKFYDEYMGDVRRHMTAEDKKVFPYVQSLLDGSKPKDSSSIMGFQKSHVGIDRKLQELKNLIIKYYNASDAGEMLNTVLFDIFNCEEDLRQHCAIEDDIFVPTVLRLEEEAQIEEREPETAPPSTEVLSEREKEIIACIVKGMKNREVAEKLFISVNTVLTHRKNIFRKLDIHSVSGLTIYAIASGIVRVEDVKL